MMSYGIGEPSLAPITSDGSSIAPSVEMTLPTPSALGAWLPPAPPSLLQTTESDNQLAAFAAAHSSSSMLSSSAFSSSSNTTANIIALGVTNGNGHHTSIMDTTSMLSSAPPPPASLSSFGSVGIGGENGLALPASLASVGIAPPLDLVVTPSGNVVTAPSSTGVGVGTMGPPPVPSSLTGMTSSGWCWAASNPYDRPPPLHLGKPSSKGKCLFVNGYLLCLICLWTLV
jgi:hypothetical protein